MTYINNIGFRGGSSECTGSAARKARVTEEDIPNIKDQPAVDTVNFRGQEYPYYGESSKKTSPLLGITLTVAGVLGAIVGLGYAHKSGSIAKMKEGTLRDKIAEPVTSKCHEWCSWAKKNGTECWNKIFKKGK